MLQTIRRCINRIRSLIPERKDESKSMFALLLATLTATSLASVAWMILSLMG